jgi:hypothetical protein
MSAPLILTAMILERRAQRPKRRPLGRAARLVLAAIGSAAFVAAWRPR